MGLGIRIKPVRQTTPKSAAPLLIPRPRAAAKLMHMQLNIKPVNRKNAIREIDRSSFGVRDEANIDRRRAGVTGIRGLGVSAGCGSEWWSGRAVGVDEVEVVDDIQVW